MDDAEITLKDILGHMQGMERRLLGHVQDVKHELLATTNGMESRLDSRIDGLELRLSTLGAGVGEIDRRLDRIEITLLPVPRTLVAHERRIRAVENGAE